MPVGRRLILVAAFLLALPLTVGQTAASRGNYTAIYVFGVSLSSAALTPTTTYPNGRYTNGLNYVDVMAEKLGLGAIKPSTAGGTNYAVGSATAADIRNKQVGGYLESLGGGSADPEALYIINGGGVEQSTALTTGAGEGLMTTAAGDIIACVSQLADKGAVHFLILGIIGSADWPPLAGVEGASELARAFHRTLDTGLRNLDGLAIVRFDLDQFLSSSMSSFSNTTGYYLATGSGNPDEYLWYDGGYHPTAAGHRLLGESALKELLAFNRKPEAVGSIPDTSLYAGGAPYTRDLGAQPGLFVDADGDILTFTVSSLDTLVTGASISGDTLVVVPRSEGTTTVFLSVDDGYGGRISMTFRVTVVPINYSLSLDLDVSEGDQSVSSLPGARPDSLYSVQVHCDGIRDATGLSATVSYDSAGLTYEGFVDGGTFTALSVEAQAGSATLLISGSSPQGAQSADSGLVATLSFRTAASLASTALEVRDVELNRNGQVEKLGSPIVARLSQSLYDFDGDGAVAFSDFVLSAGSFGSREGLEGFSPRYDLDSNGIIGFSDFVLFARHFGEKVSGT